MKGILKWPLIIAAFLVVVRVVLERAGAPETINNIFSVVVFYVLIAPLYFAFRIAGSGIAAPYKNLLKTTALFTALARSMVIPTYWLAGLPVSVAAVSIQCCRRRQCGTGRLTFHGLRWNSAGGCSRMDPDLAHRGRRIGFYPYCREAQICQKSFGYSYRATAFRRSLRLGIRSTKRMTSIAFCARTLPRTFSERARNFFPRNSFIRRILQTARRSG